MTNTCPNCHTEAANRVETIAHARRLTKIAIAEIEIARDALLADMPQDVVLDCLRDALRILSKMPTNHS